MKKEQWNFVFLVIMLAGFFFTIFAVAFKGSFILKNGIEQEIDYKANEYTITTTAWNKDNLLYLSIKYGTIKELEVIKCIEYAKAKEIIDNVKILQKQKCK